MNVADELAKHLANVVSGTETKPQPPVIDPNYFDDDSCDEEGKMFSEVFGYTPQSGNFPVTLHGDSNVDVAHYIFPEEETAMLVRSLENGMKTRLVGDPGTGKTELVKQVCARLGRKFARLNFNTAMEPDDIFGGLRLVNEEGVSTTKWVDGEFITWIKEGYTILFDEINRAPSSFHMAMQRLMEEGGVLHIPGKLEGETVITPHENTAFCAADNTKGLGDEMDRFGSAHIQDVSSLNRWEVCVVLNYLNEQQELQLINQWCEGLHDEMTAKMATVSGLLHAAYKSREIDLPFSPRTLKTWTTLTAQTKNPVMALKWCFVNSLPSDQQNVVQRIVCDTVRFPKKYGGVL